MSYSRVGKSILCILILVHASLGFAASASSLDRAIKKQMMASHIRGASCCIIKHGQIVFSGHYGFTDPRGTSPVQSDTAFMLASVSKTITGVALMTLYDQGKFKLDDPIAPFLKFPVVNPNFHDTPITFRMVLTHTSSIQDSTRDDAYSVSGDSPISLEDFLASYFTPGGTNYSAKDNFLNSEPGTVSQYSNVGIALAGYLVQTISGQSFEAYCAKTIFQPLGMANTAWRLAQMDVTKVALPCTYDAPTKRFTSGGNYGYPDIPNGALRTSVTELAKFLQMFMGNGQFNGVRILSESAAEEMRSPQTPLDSSQGLVWYYSKVASKTLLGHNGSDTGVSTDMFFDPITQTGLIVLCNTDNDVADKLLPILVKAAGKMK